MVSIGWLLLLFIMKNRTEGTFKTCRIRHFYAL